MTDTTNGPVPTPAAEWRQGALYRLPSGFIARLKRAPLLALIGRGLIPNPYAQQVKVLLAIRDAADTEAKRAAVLEENARAFLYIASLEFIEPRLVLEGVPGEGEIGPEDLSDRDLIWLYYDLAEGVADDVALFRLN
jgi:hypothetical protein